VKWAHVRQEYMNWIEKTVLATTVCSDVMISAERRREAPLGPVRCLACFKRRPMLIITIIKTTRLSVTQAVSVTGWPAGRWRLAWSKWAWSTHATVSASQEQTLSGRGARVYTAHRGWLGVVTGISAASTGGVLVYTKYMQENGLQ